MNKRLVKVAFLILAVAAAALAFPLTAYADMGPKAALTVTVRNPPAEPYYLDLLMKSDGSGSLNDNLHGKRDLLDQTMLQQLYSGTDAGWWPALAGGTKAPLFGSLTGTAKGDTMVHTFSYYGVPDTYRIIIVTQSGKVTVSDTRVRENLQSSITFDYSSGSVTEPPLWHALLLQFVSTLIPTLVIEGLLLLAFGFKLRGNLLVFLLSNLVTQIILTLVTGAAQYKYGIMATILVFLLAEFFILIAESVVYALLLKGRSRGRGVGYAVTANIVSCVAGIMIMAVTGLW